jgi:hypothetical protein
MHPTPRTDTGRQMSSAKPFKTTLFPLLAAIGLIAAIALLGAQSASAAKKLPVITNVDPKSNVAINQTITVTGRNFIKGKNAMRIVFQRAGSKRRFTARATASSTKKLKVKVPNLLYDLTYSTVVRPIQVNDNIYRLRAISKVGVSKQSAMNKSPQVVHATAISEADKGASGDCDGDGQINSKDSDDDNDLLADHVESQILTDPCKQDTDGDISTDYYEYRVAVEYNGGQPPVLPYPKKMPYPNPLVGDGTEDFDGDKMSHNAEFKTWQYSKRDDRFYSDADQDSDGDGTRDGWEDEDGDQLPNLVEFGSFPKRPLDWLDWDSDGDGLCDSLDDQDHDGAATPLHLADCSTPVPNNGPLGTPVTSTGGGDPNLSLIDADDNLYSNYYEWYTVAGYTQWGDGGGAENPCIPDPDGHYCPSDLP